MQTVATAGARKKKKKCRGERHDRWPAKEGSRRCAANAFVFFSLSVSLFFSGHGGNAANSCFSAAGKNENALFIRAPSIMNPASAEGGLEEEGRGVKCMCE